MGHFFDPWRVFSDFLIICATDMQMCMHLSLLRPGVCRKKGGGGGALVQIPPLWVYGWQPQRRNAGKESTAGVIRVYVSIVVMLWRVMVVYVIVWQ